MQESKLQYENKKINSYFQANEKQSNNLKTKKNYCTFAKKVTNGFVRLTSWFAQKLFGAPSITENNLTKAIDNAHKKGDTDAFKQANKKDLISLNKNINNIKEDIKLSKILENKEDLNKKLTQLQFRNLAYIAQHKTTELIKQENSDIKLNKLNDPDIRSKVLPRIIANDIEIMNYLSTFNFNVDDNLDYIAKDMSSIALYEAYDRKKEINQEQAKNFIIKQVKNIKSGMDELTFKTESKSNPLQIGDAPKPKNFDEIPDDFKKIIYDPQNTANVGSLLQNIQGQEFTEGLYFSIDQQKETPMSVEKVNDDEYKCSIEYTVKSKNLNAEESGLGSINYSYNVRKDSDNKIMINKPQLQEIEFQFGETTNTTIKSDTYLLQNLFCDIKNLGLSDDADKGLDAGYYLLKNNNQLHELLKSLSSKELENVLENVEKIVTPSRYQQISREGLSFAKLDTICRNLHGELHKE